MTEQPPQGNMSRAAGKRRNGFSLLVVVGVSMLLGGCSLGHHNFLNENDKLRSEKLHLQEQVKQLHHQLELTQGENQNLQAQLHPHAATMPTAEVPALAKVQMGRGTGVLVNDHRTFRVYLITLDQKGRFLPVAGRATVKIVAIPDKGKPVTLADMTFEPKAFDAAYRSTLMGTHYSLDVTLPRQMPVSADHLTVKVIFTQAATGVKFKTQGIYGIK